jgi:glycosyltransferase involved in cell wall biosynthesis
MVIVHNDNTKQALIELGVKENVIETLTLPVPVVDQSKKSNLITQKLNKKDGDTILALTGFIHQFKGIDHAIKALTYLPSSYKLAIIGGMHQDHDASTYNALTDLIRDLKLQERVYITGYVESDEDLNAYVRECDIAVYPYDKHYYSNISSASLNNGFANNKPVIAYPTDSFIELNRAANCLTLTQSFAYYELAREVESIDMADAISRSKSFASNYGYDVVSKQLEYLYKK